jgi:prolipoprotein diacylglyceryltransferase
MLYMVSIVFGIYVAMNIYGRHVRACSDSDKEEDDKTQTVSVTMVVAIILTILLLMYIGYFLMYKATTVAATHVRDSLSPE